MKRYLGILKIVFSLVLFGCLPVPNPMTAQSLSKDTVQIPRCVMLIECDAPCPSPLPDSLFNDKAVITIYRVNSTTLRANDNFVRLLDSQILPLANKNEWKILGIEVRGGASPEGPYANNVRLANGRATNILRYINDRLIHKCQLQDMKISTVPEDYAYLLWLLQRAGDSGADVLAKIIARRGIDNHAAIKADMLKVSKGRWWKRLLRDYFPKVRAGRVVLFFTPYRPPEPEPEPEPEPTIAIEVPPIEGLSTLNIPEPGNVLLKAIPNYEPLLEPLPSLLERRHMLSVSTNLLYDVFYMPQYGWAPMPNVNLEYFPKTGNYTYRFQFLFPYYHRWNKNKFFQIRDYHLEVRRYFSPDFYHTGWYLGAYVEANKYGIGLSATKGWQGEGIGGAVKAGYVMRLGESKRWRLDFHLAFGGYTTRYDPYVYGNPITGEIDGDYFYDWTGGTEAFRRRNHRFTWFGPTEAGVTISFDVLFWRQRRSGVSYYNQEWSK